MHGQPLSIHPHFELLMVILLIVSGSFFCLSWVLFLLKRFAISAISSVIFHLASLTMAIFVLVLVAGVPELVLAVLGLAVVANLPNACLTYVAVKRIPRGVVRVESRVVR